MVLRVLLLFVVALGSLYSSEPNYALDEQESVWLQQNKKLRVRVAPNLLPIQDIQNGKPKGIAVEYMEAFAKEFGLEIEYVQNYSWQEAIKRIENRDGIDILLQAQKTQERAQKMLFTHSYAKFPYVFVKRRYDNSFQTSNFSNKRLALVKNYVINKHLKELSPQTQYIEVNNNLEALEAVSSSKVDAYVGNIGTVSNLIKEHGLANLQISNIFPYPTQGYSMVTAKDWPEFISIFNKFHATLSQNICEQIKREYVPIFSQRNFDTAGEILRLSEEERAFVRENPVIYVSNEHDWYPYDFNENGQAQGYGVDLLKILAQKIGFELEFYTASWSELMEAFKKREIDILYPASKTKQRQEIALFSKPFITTKQVIISKNSKSSIQSIDELKDLRVASGKGWTATKLLKEKFPDMKLLEFDTSLEMHEAVAFGIADVSIDDYFTANYIMNHEMLSNLKVNSKINLFELQKSELHLMVHKDKEILLNLFERAKAKLANEELVNLRKKWIAEVQKEQALDLSKDEKLYLEQKEQIKMCIDPDWMPLEANSNGKHIGMSADYMQLFEEKMGIPIEMVSSKTWLESIELAKQRECDIFSLAMPTPERLQYMDFTNPYLKVPLVLVTQPSEIFFADIASIQDEKIGVVKGYAYAEILKTRYPKMQLVDVENVSVGMEMVENGDIFGFVGTLATVGYKIKKEFYGALKITGKFDETWELGVGVRNDEPLLLSVFNKAIDSIDEQNHNRILNKWITLEYGKRFNYDLFWKILFAFVILGILMLMRQYQLKSYNKKLKVLSTTDALTGIFNRLKLDEVLEDEKRLFDRYARSLSVILMDIDDFKRVNDSFGHKIGDDVLCTIANILDETKRDTDILGRWGGEEFLIICRQTDIQGAYELALKCKSAIENHDFTNANQKQTASFGVAQLKSGDSIEQLFHRADEALYLAKASGKNCVKTSKSL